MRRRAVTDLLILGLLAPLWLVCLFLHVERIASGRLVWFPFYVELPAHPGEAPSFRRWNPELPPPGDLLPGDRLLRVGDRDLTGAGRIRLLSAVLGAVGPDGRARFEILRSGERRQLDVALAPVANAWRVAAAAVLGVGSFFGLWRGRGTWQLRAWMLAGIAYSFHLMVIVGGPAWQVALGLVTLVVSGATFAPLALTGVLLFPMRLRNRRLAPYLAVWIFAGIGPALWIWLFDTPLPAEWGLAAVFGLMFGFGACLLVLLARRFVRANPPERRQLSWVLLGFVLGLGPVAAAAGIRAVDALDGVIALPWLYQASLAATAAIPPCLLIALQKRQFLDIRRLFTATLVYGLVVAVGVAILVGLLATSADSLAPSLGLDPWPVSALLSALLLALLLLAARFVHPRVMRRLAPETERLEALAARLPRDLRALATPSQVFTRIAEQLADTLALESCALYGRTEDGFVPTFTRGPAVPFAFASDGPLPRALASDLQPVRVAGLRPSALERALGTQDSTVLDALDARVVLPLSHQETLAGFLILGEKRSGDVFSSADLHLLASVGQIAALQLERFDLEAVAAGQRTLSAELAKRRPCFMSYSSHDDEFARKVHADLERRGISCWFAPETLRIGDRWKPAVDHGLAQAERVLVVLSEHSLASAWVAYEVTAALDRSEAADTAPTVFPIRIDDSVVHATEGWPLRLRERVHIGDFRRWRDEADYARALERLVSDLSQPLRRSES